VNRPTSIAQRQSKIPASFTFSQSSLQDFADCPRRFLLRYIDQLSWPAVEAEPVVDNERRQQEGQVFHRLAQQHLLGLPAENLERLANTPELSRWWKSFQFTNFGLSGYTQHTELSLSCPLPQTSAGDGAHRLLAKYDLVATRDGQALIFDWKTSLRRPKDEWLAARWQTRVYRALFVRAGAYLNDGKPFEPEQVTMTYWFADFPSESAVFKYDATQYQRDWSDIEQAVEKITSAAEFPLTPDEKMCRFCTYRSYCDRGISAADWKADESDSDAEAGFDVNFEQIGEIEF
jgi:CRISPR/Cas system-associated exonuclease Cas4 (RecB family)